MIPQELEFIAYPCLRWRYELLLNSDEARWFGSDNWVMKNYEPKLETMTTFRELRELYPDANDAHEIEKKLNKAKRSCRINCGITMKSLLKGPRVHSCKIKEGSKNA